MAVTCIPTIAQGATKITKTEVERRFIVDKGLTYLAKVGQSDSGTFSDKVGPGVTALAITSALRNGRGVDDPMVAEGLKALKSFVKPDGGICGNGRLRNYETCVEDNPGMGSAGLYYYYHTFAAGLSASGLKTIDDVDGTKHNWKADLIAELAQRQNKDGSWSNENQRWFENDKNLATSFAPMALAYCK